MRIEVLYGPSFAIARVLLEYGEAIRAESGAMMSMSPNLQLNSKVEGGLGKAIGRMFGGESFFQSTFTATTGAGELLLAPSTPGDLVLVEPGMGLMVTSGCFLAGDVRQSIETQASLKSFFGGEGLFILRISGPGQTALSSFGAIHVIQLGPGQPYIVDTGHLVAFTAGMGFEVRRATRSLWGSLTSREGVVVHLVGPGLVYTQTRTPHSFAGYLNRFLPARGG